jgi:AcrR family transcriptional regulator
MPRAKQRTPQLREHVLSVALATLADGGVAGFTTRRVAEQAQTSTPAVYELFGDKTGLVREVFFAGFRLLGERFARLEQTADPRADLVAVLAAFRAFARENPVLAELMFARPFADFGPAPDERATGSAVRELIVAAVARCTGAGLLHGPDRDIAHVLVALAQGLAAQEVSGWLGSTPESRDRRWALAIAAVLAGLAAPAGALALAGSPAGPAAG